MKAGVPLRALKRLRPRLRLPHFPRLRWRRRGEGSGQRPTSPRARRQWVHGQWTWPRRLGDRGAAILGSIALIAVAVTVAGVAGRTRTTTGEPSQSVVVSGTVRPTRSGALSSVAPLWPSEDPVTPTHAGSATFTALTGVGCRATSNAGYYVAYPAGTVPVTRRGGWSGSGCTGIFWTIPMAGAARTESRSYVVWWFATPGIPRASCDLMMYVPKPDRPQDAAGRPTRYLVLRGRADPTVIGSFAIDQTVNNGRWVASGRYALDEGQIAVKMLSDGSGGPADQHAAAQAWIGCVPQ